MKMNELPRYDFSENRKILRPESPESSQGLLEIKPRKSFSTTIPKYGLKVKIARRKREKIEAYKLVHDVYVKSGFITPDRSGMRKTIFSDLPDTSLLIGVRERKIIATLSAFGDSQYGLPTDALFRTEINKLRNKGRRLVEVGALACLDSSMGILISLQKIIIQYLTEQHYDDILAITHPDHLSVYERLYGFKCISQVKAYSAVNNNLAVLSRLKLS